MRDITYHLKRGSERRSAIGEAQANQLVAAGWRHVTFVRMADKDGFIVLLDADDSEQIAKYEANGCTQSGTQQTTIASPIEGYDDFAADAIIALAPTLPLEIRNRAAHYELGNQNRREVIDALRID